MIHALIFDFDGLVIDTETPAFESWREIFAEHNHDLTLEMWEDALGRGPGMGFDALEHLAAALGDTFDREATLARRTARKHALSLAQPLLPGVESMLEQARTLGLSCAVASSSGREWVEGWLRRHGIYDAFTCVRTADDVAATKPAPDLFLSAAACLGVSPGACLVFEDSANGILAARAAGMRVVAVPGAITAQLQLPPADLVLPALDGLPLSEIVTMVEPQRHEDTKS